MAQTHPPGGGSQWFTGSLLSPSGAPTHPDVVAIEPYVLFGDTVSRYAPDGHTLRETPRTRSATTFTLLEYSLTDRLAVRALPQFGYQWDGRGTSSGMKFSDLPVEALFRFVDATRRSGYSSLALLLGVIVPTGDADHLGRPLDGVGTGMWSVRVGLIDQTRLRLPGWLPGTGLGRLRVWVRDVMPLAGSAVRDASVFGTASGFRGHVSGGNSGDAGAAVELGLTRHLVASMDVVRNRSGHQHLRGDDASGRIDRHLSSAGQWSVAPAVEYNWSGKVGLIVGAQIPFAGHDLARIITPQAAVNLAF